MAFPSETFVAQFTTAHQMVGDELRHLYAQLVGFLSAEHDEEGRHTDLTAASLTVSDTGALGVLQLTTRTTAHLTANVNNAALNGGGRVVLTADGAYDITGIVAGADGELLWLINNSAFAQTLKNDSASSATGNKIATNGGSDLVVSGTNGTAILIYDATLGYWFVR